MELAPKSKCTGCMACVHNCPTNCISAEQDLLGHQYPVVDRSKCINCGKCQRTCPELSAMPAQMPRQAFAAWSLDAESRRTSTSGGAAAELYRAAIHNGFWIVGVEYQKDFHVVHVISNEETAIAEFKQSKYVYSEMDGIYQKVKDMLLRGEKILFISLPCKIAGLLGYLGDKFDNLVTVDIVCHGTPSYKNLLEHIRYVVKEDYPEKLGFRRDNEYLFQLMDRNGKAIYKKNGRTDTYLAAFLEGLNYRESCYYCSYAKPERISDITICDFWGLGREIPFNHPYTGAISAVLINTDEGQDFWKCCMPQMFTEERPVMEAIKGNAQMNAPTPMHLKRKAFESMYQSDGFEAAVKHCLGEIMKAEERKIRRQNVRRILRKAAGIFVKRYRG